MSKNTNQANLVRNGVNNVRFQCKNNSALTHCQMYFIMVLHKVRCGDGNYFVMTNRLLKKFYLTVKVQAPEFSVFTVNTRREPICQ